MVMIGPHATYSLAMLWSANPPLHRTAKTRGQICLKRSSCWAIVCFWMDSWILFCVWPQAETSSVHLNKEKIGSIQWAPHKKTSIFPLTSGNPRDFIALNEKPSLGSWGRLAWGAIILARANSLDWRVFPSSHFIVISSGGSCFKGHYQSKGHFFWGLFYID